MSKETKLKAHEFCALFPAMPADEFRGLKESIKVNGQLNPVVIYDGKILDGAHRYRACTELGVEPVVEEFKGKDAFGFVFDSNIKRRHLNSSQRACLAAKLANIKNGGKKNGKTVNGFPSVSVSEAAKLLSISKTNISHVKRIRKADEDLIFLIESGEMTVGAALEEAKLIEEKQRVVSELHDAGDSDLAAKVECGIKTVEAGIKELAKIHDRKVESENRKPLAEEESVEGYYTDESEVGDSGELEDLEVEESPDGEDTRTDAEKEREFLLKRLKDMSAAADDVNAHLQGYPNERKVLLEIVERIEDLKHWAS